MACSVAMPEEDLDKAVFIRGRVPEPVRARFKAVCAYLGRDMSDVLLELIEGWLQEKKQAAVERRTSKNPPKTD